MRPLSRFTIAARIALCLPLAGLPACNILDGGDCTAIASFMLVVTVTNASGAPIAGGYTLAVYSAAPVDSLVLPVSPQEAVASVSIPEGVRPGWSGGFYSVEIRATGYQTWRRDLIRVKEGSCAHTIPTPVAATLLAQ